MLRERRLLSLGQECVAVVGRVAVQFLTYALHLGLEESLALAVVELRTRAFAYILEQMHFLQMPIYGLKCKLGTTAQVAASYHRSLFLRRERQVSAKETQQHGRIALQLMNILHERFGRFKGCFGKLAGCRNQHGHHRAVVFLIADCLLTQLGTHMQRCSRHRARRRSVASRKANATGRTDKGRVRAVRQVNHTHYLSQHTIAVQPRDAGVLVLRVLLAHHGHSHIAIGGSARRQQGVLTSERQRHGAHREYHGIARGKHRQSLHVDTRIHVPLLARYGLNVDYYILIIVV